MFPRMIKVEAWITRSRIMPNPPIVRVHMGRVWMSGSVGKVRCCRRGGSGG
jgi:hypothetical protein